VSNHVGPTGEKKVMIHVHDLWKRYGSLEVLKGLFLDVYEGETVVILGRSGVGKSVLLKQIIGIEKPDHGYVEISGERVLGMPQYSAGKKNLRIGMLFQGSALFDSMTVGENTAFFLRQHENLSEKEIKQRVEETLEMVGLSGTQNKMPSDLSGGMRKRAALARVVVYRPSIILYDEPTTGLDPMTAMQINELINKTQQELRATSIVVTHDIRSALEVGDRLAFHYEGKIAQIAPKDEFFKIDDPIIHSFFENAALTEDFFKF
jgi:phospholipid/cholesterol/gamma-HCH transport system ATP-binding protein